MYFRPTIQAVNSLLHSASCGVCLAVFQEKRTEMWKLFPELSNDDDKNEAKTVKSVFDPKEPTR